MVLCGVQGQTEHIVRMAGRRLVESRKRYTSFVCMAVLSSRIVALKVMFIVLLLCTSMYLSEDLTADIFPKQYLLCVEPAL